MLLFALQGVSINVPGVVCGSVLHRPWQPAQRVAYSGLARMFDYVDVHSSCLEGDIVNCLHLTLLGSGPQMHGSARLDPQYVGDSPVSSFKPLIYETDRLLTYFRLGEISKGPGCG